MSDMKLLAQTMREFSDTAGDHHWQAGCAIDQLTAENEALREQLDDARKTATEWSNKGGRCAAHDAEVIERFLATEAPRIDAGGPNPIDPELHHCEWTLHQERERLHAAANQLRQQAKENNHE